MTYFRQCIPYFVHTFTLELKAERFSTRDDERDHTCDDESGDQERGYWVEYRVSRPFNQKGGNDDSNAACKQRIYNNALAESPKKLVDTYPWCPTQSESESSEQFSE